MSAVSARPLRAPCVDKKYSFTERPSRKFATMGVSMMRPSGRVISPRMPANWRICVAEPRAPESEYMNTELNSIPACADCSPLASLRSSTVGDMPMGSSLEIPPIIASAIWPSTWPQTSTTLLYFSPSVTRPDTNCFSISSTSTCASAMIAGLFAGITKSSMPMDAPANVELAKPMYMSWSANTTVSFKPTLR